MYLKQVYAMYYVFSKQLYEMYIEFENLSWLYCNIPFAIQSSFLEESQLQCGANILSSAMSIQFFVT
jgi:hypothetical protein